MKEIDNQLIDSTYEEYYNKYGDYDSAVELTAEKLNIKNLDVLIHLKYELLIPYLIHNKLIPNIDSESFFRNVYTDNWLDHKGRLED